MRVRLRATGDAEPAEVWDRYDDLDRWPVWAPQIRSVDAAARRLAPGLAGTVHPVVGPGVAFTVETVDSFDARARRWAWQARLGPARLHLEHGVEACGSGTRTWLVVRGPAPLVLAYAPLARFALHRLVRP